MDQMFSIVKSMHIENKKVLQDFDSMKRNIGYLSPKEAYTKKI